MLGALRRDRLSRSEDYCHPRAFSAARGPRGRVGRTTTLARCGRRRLTASRPKGRANRSDPASTEAADPARTTCRTAPLPRCPATTGAVAASYSAAGPAGATSASAIRAATGATASTTAASDDDAVAMVAHIRCPPAVASGTAAPAGAGGTVSTCRAFSAAVDAHGSWHSTASTQCE